MKKQFLLCLCALALCTAACNKNDAPGPCYTGGCANEPDADNKMSTRNNYHPTERQAIAPATANRMTDTLRNAPGSPQPLTPLPPDNSLH